MYIEFYHRKFVLLIKQFYHRKLQKFYLGYLECTLSLTIGVIFNVYSTCVIQAVNTTNAQSV